MFSDVPECGRNTKIRNESVRIGLTGSHWYFFYMKKFEELGYLVTDDDAYV